MTYLGLAYYGGANGLYDHPDGEEEQARALAFLADQDEQRKEAARRRQLRRQGWTDEEG